MNQCEVTNPNQEEIIAMTFQFRLPVVNQVESESRLRRNFDHGSAELSETDRELAAQTARLINLYAWRSRPVLSGLI